MYVACMYICMYVHKIRAVLYLSHLWGGGSESLGAVAESPSISCCDLCHLQREIDIHYQQEPLHTCVLPTPSCNIWWQPNRVQSVLKRGPLIREVPRGSLSWIQVLIREVLCSIYLANSIIWHMSEGAWGLMMKHPIIKNASPQGNI